MGKTSDDDTVVILKKLAIFVPCFYAFSYVLAGILIACFRIPFSANIPFNHRDFNPSVVGLPLVCWLCQILTFAFGVVLIFYVVRSTRKAWDYAVTIGFLHWVLCCLVMVSFPTNWIWWVTIVIATFLLSTLGEFACYRLRDLREIVLER
mmetsp:Transcript_24904/g.41014  ORF Transcript_24904/g.41014 Transcript_24904/m.41014 type:complete len:150 (-) Transcript_24904:215-664(-)